MSLGRRGLVVSARAPHNHAAVEGVIALDLSDSTTMPTVREELEIGVVTAVPGVAKGLEAKARIAELLAIRINSVERLKAKTGIGPRVV